MVPRKHEQCSAWRQGNLTAWVPLIRHIGLDWNLANSLIESCVASLEGLGKYSGTENLTAWEPLKLKDWIWLEPRKFTHRKLCYKPKRPGEI